MSTIVSIGTAVPAHAHKQQDIFHFMQTVYAGTDAQNRKLKHLYHKCGIDTRYSVIPDYSHKATDWKFFPPTEHLEPFPTIEKRLQLFQKYAPRLAVDAARDCLQHRGAAQVTHLITVSCTGMSAPGLDLQLVELMELRRDIFRTSINFMGCYAAIHALKLAHAICSSDAKARVLIVCVELCTIHFQQEPTVENIMSSLLFGDGAAAALVSAEKDVGGLRLQDFYSEIIPRGKRDMAWEISSSGFLMTLSNYIPELIREDFLSLTTRALQAGGFAKDDVTDWCIHPGGIRLLQAIEQSLQLGDSDLRHAYEVLKHYGNMSSATILFVMKDMMKEKKSIPKMFGAAFGPGLTVETFTACS